MTTPRPVISAAALALAERARRSASLRLGRLRTGCAAIDDDVLVDALERGTVVGISAEDEQLALALALQASAGALADAGSEHGVMVVSPQAQAVVAANVRDAVRRRVASADAVRAALARVRIARVFDLDGLAEVLAELAARMGCGPEGDVAPVPETLSSLASSLASTLLPPLPPRTEIPDSQAYNDDSSQDDDDAVPQTETPPNPPAATPSTLPTILVIAQLSSLLNGYFASHAKPTGHAAAERLGMQLRHLSRALPCGPLILLPNSTSTTTVSSAPAAAGDRLCSIFNTPPGAPSRAEEPAAPGLAIRRIRPGFGQTFDQLVDVHLLCTRVPVAGTACAEQAPATAAQVAGFAWAVEVLSDRVGVWTASDEQERSWARLFRHQRWGVAHFCNGVVVGCEPERSR